MRTTLNLGEIIGIGQSGVDPAVMGLGPTTAIKKALNHAGLNPSRGLMWLNSMKRFLLKA